MYTYITEDNRGNFFISKQYFNTKEEAEEVAYGTIEYDFIISIQIVKCEDVVNFNLTSSVYN